MSQYPTCKHNWGDMLATCPQCDAEEKDATIKNLRNELESATANIAELLDLIRLAHEWGANGVKGYSADKAMTFRDEAENILSNENSHLQSGIPLSSTSQSQTSMMRSCKSTGSLNG